MNKVFEDYFSEIHSDMVDICLEYVDERAEKIYIYCSNEGGALSCNYFYKINNSIVQKHMINSVLKSNEKKYDVAGEVQFQVLEILNADMESIVQLCKKYNRDIPTEIKAIYEVKTHKFNANFKYEPVYSNDSAIDARDVFNEWFEEIREQEVIA